MGSVYRARDLHFPNVVKRVAVKEMVNQVRDPAMRETIIRNFEREANILATLEHPNIPRIFDYFTQNDRSYLILEFVEGKDLESLLNDSQGFFPEEQVIRWAVELCDVLNFLHGHQPEPIIFRDMKPSNVMISNHDHVMLVDFGIAKTFQAGTRGTMIGTEGYSPPEQYKGEANPLSDIYALGATLHHVLTRRDPRLEAPFSFAERPIRNSNPSITLEFETIINTALQYNPANRFQSIKEMKEALIAAGRKTGFFQSEMKSSKIDEESSKLAWRFECEDEIRGTPIAHNGIVFVGSYDHNLYALEADSGEFIWKYASDGGIVTRPWAHEGNILFGSEDKRLHVVSQRSGKVVWTYFSDGPIRSSPYVAEGHVFFGSDDGCMHAVNTMTGRRAWRTEVGSCIRSTPFVDGDRVYFGTESGDYFCLDLSGTIKWRFKAKRSITSSSILHQDVIYFTSVDSTLYALDCNSGFVIMRYRLPKPSISTPCIIENLLYLGTVDNAIYGIDYRSAKEIWSFRTEHQVTASPVPFRDSILCGSVDGHLYCLDYKSGRLRWKFKTDGHITGSAATSEDKIFIGSTDHRLYAIIA
jgi:outer membrane protein assembly factor BamB/tRNA A-37 threonylcarbamoyl transferase component Bud32